MGSCVTHNSVSNQNKLTNISITTSLQKEKVLHRNTQRFLFYGIGSSGISTIFKQLKQIYDGGFDHDDFKIKYVVPIHTQCIKQMQVILDSLEDEFYDIKEEKEYLLSKQGLKYKKIFLNNTDYETLLLYGYIRNIEQYLSTNLLPIEITELINDYIPKFVHDNSIIIKLNDAIVKSIKHLWSEAAVKNMYKIAKTTNIQKSSAFFWDNIDRIYASDYIPTKQDILLCNHSIKKVKEQHFTYKNQEVHIIDPTGQYAERSKWIGSFEHVDAVIFVASLSCYNETLWYDDDYNAMHEQLLLLNEIRYNHYFKKVPKILWLNKLDIFKDKIKTSPISKYYPEYKKDTKSYEESLYFIEKLLKGNWGNSYIYRHNLIETFKMCAMNQNDVKKVFEDTINAICRCFYVPHADI